LFVVGRIWKKRPHGFEFGDDGRQHRERRHDEQQHDRYGIDQKRLDHGKLYALDVRQHFGHDGVLFAFDDVREHVRIDDGVCAFDDLREHVRIDDGVFAVDVWKRLRHDRVIVAFDLRKRLQLERGDGLVVLDVRKRLEHGVERVGQLEFQHAVFQHELDERIVERNGEHE
jgi:hypothetical protein